jgi:hypothetical protein
VAKEHELWTGDRGVAGIAPFGAVSDADERLHPEASIPGDSLTETWAYMWYIPEERISSMIHLWVHPNLNVVTAGIAVWRGHKQSMISCELVDIPVFTSAAGLGDGMDMTFASGLRVTIEEPFKRMRIRYEDRTRGNALDLTVTDFSPPAMRSAGKHFDQAIRTRGSLTLRGTPYKIDGYGMRDRSWGQLRTEVNVPAPPFTWMTGTFPRSGFSWHVAANDDPALNPDWLGMFDIPRDHLVHDTWLYRDGVLSRPKHVSSITTRDPQTLRPLTHRVQFVDRDRRAYDIRGKVLASVPWNAWLNMSCFICLTEWSLDGEIGYGDTQEVQWSDYVHVLRQDQDPPPPARR